MNNSICLWNCMYNVIGHIYEIDHKNDSVTQVKKIAWMNFYNMDKFDFKK